MRYSDPRTLQLEYSVPIREGALVPGDFNDTDAVLQTRGFDSLGIHQ